MVIFHSYVSLPEGNYCENLSRFTWCLRLAMELKNEERSGVLGHQVGCVCEYNTESSMTCDDLYPELPRGVCAKVGYHQKNAIDS